MGGISSKTMGSPASTPWTSASPWVRDGSVGSAVFSWSPGGRGLRGLWAGQPEEPLPAIVSPEVLALADVSPGDELSLGMSTFTVPITVAAVADYFPTLYPREHPFVVLDLRGLNHYGNRHNRRLVGGSNELWASLNGSPPDMDQVLKLLEAEGLAGEGDLPGLRGW